MALGSVERRRIVLEREVMAWLAALGGHGTVGGADAGAVLARLCGYAEQAAVLAGEASAIGAGGPGAAPPVCSVCGGPAEARAFLGLPVGGGRLRDFCSKTCREAVP